MDLQDLQENNNLKTEVSEDVKLLKEKKPRTPKQIEALNKAKEKAKINAEMRKKQREEEEKIRKAEEEELIIKKAISLKKKQIKRQQVLDEISDDETPLEQIKNMKQEQIKKPIQPEKPLTIFQKYKFI
jgi:hypothetical protein